MRIRGKNPTRRQKKAISEAGLNWHNWLVQQITANELHIQHKESGKTRIIPA